MDFEWWHVHGGSLFGTNVPSDEGWWGGGGTVWGQGIWQAFVPSVQFCYEPKTMLCRKVCLKKKRTLVSKDFHHGVIYWSENLKASHLSGQIGWLVHPWIECSCFTGWAATKRCLGKAHNMDAHVLLKDETQKFIYNVIW